MSTAPILTPSPLQPDPAGLPLLGSVPGPVVPAALWQVDSPQWDAEQRASELLWVELRRALELELTRWDAGPKDRTAMRFIAILRLTELLQDKGACPDHLVAGIRNALLIDGWLEAGREAAISFAPNVYYESPMAKSRAQFEELPVRQSILRSGRGLIRSVRLDAVRQGDPDYRRATVEWLVQHRLYHLASTFRLEDIPSSSRVEVARIALHKLQLTDVEALTAEQCLTLLQVAVNEVKAGIRPLSQVLLSAQMVDAHLGVVDYCNGSWLTGLPPADSPGYTLGRAMSLLGLVLPWEQDSPQFSQAEWTDVIYNNIELRFRAARRISHELAQYLKKDITAGHFTAAMLVELCSLVPTKNGPVAYTKEHQHGMIRDILSATPPVMVVQVLASGYDGKIIKTGFADYIAMSQTTGAPATFSARDIQDALKPHSPQRKNAVIMHLIKCRAIEQQLGIDLLTFPRLRKQIVDRMIGNEP